MEQAMFDVRANNSIRTRESELVYTYNVPGHGKEDIIRE